MKTKKAISILTAIALIGTLGMSSVFAADNSKDGEKESPAISDTRKNQKADANNAKVNSKERQSMSDTQRLQKSGRNSTKAVSEGRAESSGVQRQQRGALTDEQKAKMQEQLAQALADGKITQEQYDEIISNTENGTFPMFGGMKGARTSSGGKKIQSADKKGERPELTDEQKAEMEAKWGDKAQFTGKTGEWSELTDEQKAEMEAKWGDKAQFTGKMGERPELTDEQKAEMEAEMEAKKSEMSNKLAKDLADGKITQEQYDEMSAAIQDGKMPMGFGKRNHGKFNIGEKTKSGENKQGSTTEAP